jgi:aquaglyceroporin related protein
MSDEKAIKSGPSSPAISHDEHAKHLNGEGSSSDSEHKPYAEHGPGIDHHIPQDDVVQAEPELWWSRTRHVIREPLAEFFGVFILILFGDG